MEATLGDKKAEANGEIKKNETADLEARQRGAPLRKDSHVSGFLIFMSFWSAMAGFSYGFS
jgi:hypothetical protein